jgi:hypothetical protein
MPKWLQIALHLLLIAAGGYMSFASGTALPLVISSGVQAAVGAIAQHYNTDGTPQSVAFVQAPGSPPDGHA